MAKKPKTREQQRVLRQRAMPEVQRLVKRYGRVTIASCLNKIKARDRVAARIASLRKEARALGRGLKR